MSRNIEEQLSQDGFYVSTTVGVSMRPMLRDRQDRVIIKPVGTDRLSRWDLPLYRRPDGKYVLHRIIAVKDGVYIIRGDNTYEKEEVPHEWILGVMTEFYRGTRHVSATNRGYRLYAALWQRLYPLRYPIHLLRRRLARLRRKRSGK